MKTPVLLLAAALALAAAVPSVRAEEGGSTRVSPDDLEEKFYRAYYAENGLRDFAAAAAAYDEVARSAAEARRGDLRVKALLGRVRCLRTMGRADDAKAALAAVLEADPENAEAKAARDAGGEAGDAEHLLRERIRFLVFNGLQGIGENSADSARELRLLGDRCFPTLEEALRGTGLGSVEAAATYLASAESARATEMLVRVMRDAQVLYRAAIARGILFPTQLGNRGDERKAFSQSEVPALSAAAEFPEAEIRRGVVQRLVEGGDPLGDPGMSLYLRLATDPDRSVRMAALEKVADLAEEPVLALVPALRRSLASEDAGERRLAVQRAGHYTRVRDLLLDALRPLLRDPDAETRAQAFSALKESFTEGDLASMLDPADPRLAAGAAHLLKERAPWSPDTTAKVRGAIERAIRGEFGDEFVSHFLDLVLIGGPSLREPSSLIDLYARTGAPDARARPRLLASLRHNIHPTLRQPLRWDVSPQREQAIAIVEEGVEKCIGSGVILNEWVKYWSGEGVPARTAWIRAAGADDVRARAAAYSAFLRFERATTTALAPGSFPFLDRDLVDPDPQMRAYALQLVDRVPSPALAGSLRALHDEARSPEEKTRLLVALVAASGRAAEDVVRRDLADPNARHEALRLLVNELGFRDRRELDAFVEGGGDSYAVVDLSEERNPPDPALLRGFVNDLPVEKYSFGFVGTAAKCVDGPERLALLRRALGSPADPVRRSAAMMIGELRVLELWPDLLPLLEHGNHDLRAAAEKSLASLKAYAELKTSMARFGKDEATAALRTAEALLDSEDAVKRKGAVLALAALGDRSAIPAMLRALDDKDAGVREAALAALERLGGAPTPK